MSQCYNIIKMGDSCFILFDLLLMTHTHLGAVGESKTFEEAAKSSEKAHPLEESVCFT